MRCAMDQTAHSTRFFVSPNCANAPTLIVLEALVLYGWRAAGWWGVDYPLLPRLGTPWQPGSRAAQILGRGAYQGAGRR